MKKSTKGAIAAGAAAVLLLGGAGTLAFWSADTDADLGTIESGELKLSDMTCDGWELDGGDAFDASTDAIVPGDTLTRDCTTTITAVGDHLEATVGLQGGTGIALSGGNPDATGANITAAAAFAVDGTTIADGGSVTDADNGKTLTATITVDFPYGTDDATNAQNGNATQELTATLDTISVALTQVDH